MPSPPLAGVLPVLPTPFGADGELDIRSLERVVDHAVEQRCSGVVCLGLAAESYKLDDYERDTVLMTILERVDGRLPVVAACESNSIEAAVRRTDKAVRAGASAVMALPPSFVKPDPETTVAYYQEVAAAADGRPVVVQDAPGWTGVPLPVAVLEQVRRSSPNAAWVKVEAPPSAPKIRALIEAGFACIGGLGALYLLEDMDAGVSSVMPGMALLGEQVELWAALQAKDPDGQTSFDQLLPLLTFQMASLDRFIAVQKAILRSQGIIDTAVVRRPGRQLDNHESAMLAEILARISRRRQP